MEDQAPVNFDGHPSPARGRDRSESVVSDHSDDHEAAAEVATATTEALRNVTLRPSPFYKIVLTGGPCGGKTTALARLSSYLRERGFEVITCPEAFSILGSNGFEMSYFGTEGMAMVVQDTVMKLQESLEDGFEKILRARGKPGVVLCIAA